jgi:hypothetical protein
VDDAGDGDGAPRPAGVGTVGQTPPSARDPLVALFGRFVHGAAGIHGDGTEAEIEP